MSLNIGELVGYLKLDESNFTRGLIAAKAKMQAVGDSKDFKKLDSAVDTSASKFVWLATRMAALSGGIGAVKAASGAVASLSGVLGLVPAAAATGIVAISTLKLGLGDFSKALSAANPKQFDKDVAGMAPDAKATAVEIRKLSTETGNLKATVQGALFKDMADQVKALGGAYLPVLKTQLSGVASGFNEAAVSTARYLADGRQVGTVNTTLGFMRTAINAVSQAFQPAVSILLNFVSVGSGRLPGIAQGFTAAATRAAAFVQNAKDTGKLGDWIDTGLHALGQLKTILGNIIGIVTQVFGAFSGSGASALDTLERLTGTLRTFLASAAGHQALTALASVLGTVSRIVSQVLLVALRQAAPIIVALAPAFAKLAQQVGGALVSALNVAGPWLLKIANFLAENVRWLGPLAISLYAGVKAFMALNAAMKAWDKVKEIKKTLDDVGASVGKVAGQIGTFVGKTGAALGRLVGQAAAAAGRMAASAASTAASWVAAAARTVASLAVTAAQFVAQGAAMAATAAATAARVVAGWVLMRVQSLINAAQMAAAWIIAMGPVGWVIAAVIALVALIIANWNTIKTWTVNVWNAVTGWIKARASDIANWVGARIQDVINFFGWLGSLPGRVGSWFAGIYHGAVSWLENLNAWVASLPGRILGALGDLGHLLFDAGKNIVEGLWNGLVSMGGWLVSKVWGWIKSIIPGPIRAALGISSPSKVAAEIASWIPRGLAMGMDNNSAVAVTSARKLAGSVTAALTPAAAGIPTVQLATNPAAATPANQAGTAGRSLVSIANYHPPANASPFEVASDLDWLSKHGG